MKDIDARRIAVGLRREPGRSEPEPSREVLVDPQTGAPTEAYRSAAAAELRGRAEQRPIRSLVAALLVAAARRVGGHGGS